MHRPLHIWLTFVGCLLLIGGAMAWVSWHTLRLEDQREVAARSAETQERTRIALWRLDFNASALLIRENSRPLEDFVPFHTPAAYSKSGDSTAGKGTLLVPSPLLGTLPDNVLLHFQLDEKGDIVSPQAPLGEERVLALQEAASEADMLLARQRLNQLHLLLARPPEHALAPMPRLEPNSSQSRVTANEAAHIPQTNREELMKISAPTSTEPTGQAGVSGDSPSRLAPSAEQTAAMPAPNTSAQHAAPALELSKNQPRSGTWAAADAAIAQQVGVTQADNVVRSKAVQSQLNSYSMSKSKSMDSEASSQSALPKREVALAKDEQIRPSSPAAAAPRGLLHGPGERPSAAASIAQAPTPSTTPSTTASTTASNESAARPVLTDKATERVLTDKAAGRALTSEVPVRALVDKTASVPTPPLQGYWIDDALLLSRQASVDGHKVIQGVWLDWPRLQAALLAEIRDLFPDGKLEPSPTADPRAHPSDDPLRLAALPLHFSPGVLALPGLPYWSALRTSLAIALACMGLAALAVAWVLYGAVSLSERRAAFVSAVTHELRTPLTTFRLYSEMLADDMVQDPEQRRSYLSTLAGEATRLGHLVENVLAYAQLERGSARTRIEYASIDEVLDRIVPRLRQRTDQAALELRVSAGDAVRATKLHVDVAALEQILFNLVDNACKYAGPRAQRDTGCQPVPVDNACKYADPRGFEPIIHIEAATSGSFVLLRVRDHGQGIAKQEQRRIFLPFHKSANDAAHSAPGVGLGLALCRRLVSALGGEIILDTGAEKGACFVVKLPLGSD